MALGWHYDCWDVFVPDDRIQEVVDRNPEVKGFVRTSALTQQGLKECFETCIRVALSKTAKPKKRSCAIL